MSRLLADASSAKVKSPEVVPCRCRNRFAFGWFAGAGPSFGKGSPPGHLARLAKPVFF